MSEKAVVSGISLENLKDVLTAVVAEARKPVLSEREQKEIEQQQQERLANAADQKAQKDNIRAFQQVCSHMQDRGRAADKTAVIFVNQDFPNEPNGGRYLICQGCQIKIIPDAPNSKRHPEFTYDSALFNRHFQMLRMGD